MVRGPRFAELVARHRRQIAEVLATMAARATRPAAAKRPAAKRRATK